ncbi:transporter [Saitozyma podzolica]|uniref:Transporter n=1 Tax=Saitozyma podzolica TaxID=1890683 RepID=A0A427Y2J0_9TREE|nr:transporter [Saitozyma podzolica]
MPGSPLSESVDVSMWDTAKVDQAHPGSSTNSSVGAGAGSEFDANVFTLGVDPPLPDPFAHIARAAASEPFTEAPFRAKLVLTPRKRPHSCLLHPRYLVSASSSTDHVVPPLADSLCAIAVVQQEEAMSLGTVVDRRRPLHLGQFWFTRHDHTIETISAAWLLPIVSSVVAAASGGVVSTALAPFDPALARSTVIVSYVVWGTSVPLAMFIITLWIYRSALSGTPTSGAFCSVFLL